MKYEANAYHKSPEYIAINAVFTVQENRGNGLFYAKHETYGCSKDYKTPEDAVYSLLSNSGCYAITINKI